MCHLSSSLCWLWMVLYIFAILDLSDTWFAVITLLWIDFPLSWEVFFVFVFFFVSGFKILMSSIVFLLLLRLSFNVIIAAWSKVAKTKTYICMCVWVHICMYGNQKATLYSWFFSSAFTWGMGMNSGLQIWQ